MTQSWYPPPSQAPHTVYGPPASRYGSVPPSHVSIPPAPPAKKKANVALLAGIGGGALVLLAAVGGLAAWKLHTPKPGLPVDAKLLPSQTKEVGTRLIESTREANPQVKKAYLASELGAMFCKPGAGDPARRIESIGVFGSRSAKELFFDKKKLDEVGELLDCGTAMSAKLESPYQSFVSFEDEDGKLHHVMTTKVGVKDLPDRIGFSRYPFGPYKGFCRTNELLKTDDCTEGSASAFQKDGTWFLGDRTSLEKLATSVAHPREELGSGVAALKDAADATKGLPVVRLAGNPKSSKEFFMAPCTWAAVQSAAGLGEFLDGCFPSKTEERTLTEIDSRIRGAAYEMDGDWAKAGAVKGNLVFVARDSDAAKRLEKDVAEVVSDWKAHAGVYDAKLITESQNKASTHSQKKFAAVVDTFFRAIHKMKVARSGRTVTVSYDEKLSKEDVAEIEDADKSTVDKRIATAEILEAIQAKHPVPREPLAKLVGQKWATYLTGPIPADLHPAAKSPLTGGECQNIQRALLNVRYQDVNTSSRDLYYQLKWGSCFTTHLPEVTAAQRACLPAVKNAADYNACTFTATAPAGEPAESDFGTK